LLCFMFFDRQKQFCQWQNEYWATDIHFYIHRLLLLFYNEDFQDLILQDVPNM
jgi:hypothetical protein